MFSASYSASGGGGTTPHKSVLFTKHTNSCKSHLLAQDEKVLKRRTAQTSVIYLFNITIIFNINFY